MFLFFVFLGFVLLFHFCSPSAEITLYVPLLIFVHGRVVCYFGGDCIFFICAYFWRFSLGQYCLLLLMVAILENLCFLLKFFPSVMLFVIVRVFSSQFRCFVVVRLWLRLVGLALSR
ncbi:hypothetical protein DVH24_027447 [Malus domestica]|uniref:Uncharacterized protein n=1 Tax=Malus domestica TaxID=3750 RepID=A0A498HDE9_MALDO|nr:hypothetical protein DVH24_027447 [Malus domestica]